MVCAVYVCMKYTKKTTIKKGFFSISIIHFYQSKIYLSLLNENAIRLDNKREREKKKTRTHTNVQIKLYIYLNKYKATKKE